MTINTYVALDKKTVDGTVSQITFTSIPSTYTDLVLVVSGYASYATPDRTTLGLRVGNGSIDTTSLYSNNSTYGNGTTAGTNRGNTQNYIFGGVISEKYGVTTLHFQNYSNTTNYKTVISRGNSLGSTASQDVCATIGLWRSASAIDNIQIYVADGTNFGSTSTFSLYGIKNWTNIEASPKATGGYVSSDSTYWYHAFPFSSTFTPSQSLTADVLVVSGGGSAGYASYGSGGGGGAGGISYNASQSFASATTYTMTVGAGGATATGMGNQGSTSSCIGGALSFSVAGGGGGGGGSASATGTAGGNGACGGGSQGNNTTGGTGSIGYNGGSASSDSNRFASGGGGGMGAVGGNGQGGGAPASAGAGGNGISTYSSWHLATGYGENVSGSYYIAGGGGGGGDVSGTGGYGGGGSAGSSGLSGTGGGGGAKSGGAGGQGGSGIVVIRYAK